MKQLPTRIAAMTAAAVLGIGGCGTDQPPVCDSLAAVRTTTHQLGTMNVGENGLAPLRTLLQQLQAQVPQLLSDAHGQFAPEVEAVKAGAAELSVSLTAARETPDAAHLGTVRAALGALQASLRSLGDAVSGTC